MHYFLSKYSCILKAFCILVPPRRLLLDITNKIANNSSVGDDGRGRRGKRLTSLSTSLHVHFHFSLSLFSESSVEKRVLSMESFPSKLGLAGQITLNPYCTYDFLLSSHVRHRLNPCLCSGCSLGFGGWRILWQMFGSL